MKIVIDDMIVQPECSDCKEPIQKDEDFQVMCEFNDEGEKKYFLLCRSCMADDQPVEE